MNTKLDLITPNNSIIAFVDYQPQMFFGVQSHDRLSVINGALGLAKGAKAFGVPTILSAIETKNFSGHTMPQLLDVFPGQTVVERSSMNAWEDPGFVEAVKTSGRKKLIITGLWTEVCVAFPVIDSIKAGYDTYFVTDSSASPSAEAHQMATLRMIQAGATPLTWIQFVLELQRDWSRKAHYDEVMAIMREHGGAYGQGIEYAYTMVHGVPPSRAKPAA